MNAEHLRKDLKELLLADPKQINIELDEEEIKQLNLTDEDKHRLIVNRALQSIFSSFEVTLPQPTSVTLEGQLEEFGKYSDGLDKALDAYLASDIFNASVVGDLGESSGTIKALYKAYFQRKWLAEHNVLSELSDMTAKDADGKYVIDIGAEIVKYTEEISKFAVKTLVKLKENVDAVNKDLKKAGVEPGEAGSSSFGGDTGGSGDDGFGGGDEFGMGDGDGFGDMPSMDDTGTGESGEESTDTPSDETPESEESGSSDAQKGDTSEDDNTPAE